MGLREAVRDASVVVAFSDVNARLRRGVRGKALPESTAFSVGEGVEAVAPGDDNGDEAPAWNPPVRQADSGSEGGGKKNPGDLGRCSGV
jgi:hypothetical protein